MNLIIMVIMGVLGILFYNLFKAKDYIASKTFVLAVFIKENVAIWLWVFSVLIAVACALYIEPQSNGLIKTFVGFDLENTKTGWLVFGAALCGLVSNVKK